MRSGIATCNTALTSTTPYGFFNFLLMSLVEAAKRPKEFVVVPGATHTDLYDHMNKIPFDKLEKFFDNALLK